MASQTMALSQYGASSVTLLSSFDAVLKFGFSTMHPTVMGITLPVGPKGRLNRFLALSAFISVVGLQMLADTPYDILAAEVPFTMPAYGRTATRTAFKATRTGDFPLTPESKGLYLLAIVFSGLAIVGGSATLAGGSRNGGHSKGSSPSRGNRRQPTRPGHAGNSSGHNPPPLPLPPHRPTRNLGRDQADISYRRESFHSNSEGRGGGPPPPPPPPSATTSGLEDDLPPSDAGVASWLIGTAIAAYAVSHIKKKFGEYVIRLLSFEEGAISPAQIHRSISDHPSIGDILNTNLHFNSASLVSNNLANHSISAPSPLSTYVLQSRLFNVKTSLRYAIGILIAGILYFVALAVYFLLKWRSQANILRQVQASQMTHELRDRSLLKKEILKLVHQDRLQSQAAMKECFSTTFIAMLAQAAARDDTLVGHEIIFDGKTEPRPSEHAGATHAKRASSSLAPFNRDVTFEVSGNTTVEGVDGSNETLEYVSRTHFGVHLNVGPASAAGYPSTPPRRVLSDVCAPASVSRRYKAYVATSGFHVTQKPLPGHNFTPPKRKKDLFCDLSEDATVMVKLSGKEKEEAIGFIPPPRHWTRVGQGFCSSTPQPLPHTTTVNPRKKQDTGSSVGERAGVGPPVRAPRVASEHKNDQLHRTWTPPRQSPVLDVFYNHPRARSSADPGDLEIPKTPEKINKNRRPPRRLPSNVGFITSSPRVNHAHYKGFSTSTPRKDYDNRRDTWNPTF